MTIRPTHRRLTSAIRPLTAAMIALPWLLPTPALAHKFRLFATVQGQEIHGQAYFSGGGHPDDTPVLLLTPEGTPLAEGKTDAQGRFIIPLPIPLPTAPLHLQAKVDGHSASWPLDSLSSNPQPQQTDLTTTAMTNTPSPLAPQIEFAIARQIAPLREQIDHLENTTRLHDILGGLGWLVGLAGLYGWWHSRRLQKAAEGDEP